MGSRAPLDLLGQIDLRAASPSAAEFHRTVSDHLPIAIRLRTTATDDD